MSGPKLNQVQSPSVFELISSDKLKNGLREAFRYLLDSLSQLDSFKCVRLPPPDEFVLLLDLIIEFSHLKAYNASFAENLYGLVRVSAKSGAKPRSVVPSLICLTLVPYVKHKLDRHFEDLNFKESRTVDDLKKIRKYRLLKRSVSLLNLFCILRHATGQSDYHNILDRIIGICLKGRTGELADRGITSQNNESIEHNTSTTIADFLGRTLAIASYVIQFLDYWNTHTNSTPLFSPTYPIPEPPSREKWAYTDDESSNICLICEHVRQNDCALSNTGYVFCYGCLYKFVKTKQRCPVTGHPCTTDNIVKLFTSVPS